MIDLVIEIVEIVLNVPIRTLDFSCGIARKLVGSIQLGGNRVEVLLDRIVGITSRSSNLRAEIIDELLRIIV